MTGQDGEVMKERGVRQLLRQRCDEAEDALEACETGNASAVLCLVVHLC